MTNQVFIAGMFRSGTTLVSRILNAHPQAVISNDAYQPLFKAFRDAVQISLDPSKLDPDAPLDDYYFKTEKLNLMRAIRNSSFDMSTEDTDFAGLHKRLIAYHEQFAPMLVPKTDQITGNTFAEVWANAFRAISETYEEAAPSLVGFKSSWSDEFAPQMMAMNPRLKVIHVVRDPRAVCASKNSLPDDRYPWLFLLRQWRKLTGSAWLHSRPEFMYHDRVLTLRYEDLVENPNVEARRVCEFLNLEFDQRMVQPEKFVDGAGSAWSRNSSYENVDPQSFSTSSVNRWESLFEPDLIEYIEQICWGEMQLFGYEPSLARGPGMSSSLVFGAPTIAESQLAGWIRPYAVELHANASSEHALEYSRANIIAGNESVSDAIKEALCLSPRVFDDLRTMAHGQLRPN